MLCAKDSRRAVAALRSETVRRLQGALAARNVFPEGFPEAGIALQGRIDRLWFDADAQTEGSRRRSREKESASYALT